MTDIGGDRGVPLGVIEGFFGRPWSWADRRAMAGFLRELGFGFFIYAPKDDRFLRQRWREPWPAATAREVAALCEACRRNGLAFGIGLSPFELHRAPEAAALAALQEKVRRIEALGPDILCILFDDMEGGLPDLAERQARIVEAARAASTAARVIVCPSYYSYDPVLAREFGAMPENYLADLGRLLDPDLDIFWTGPRVCSRRYPPAHLEEVAGLLRRKPFLWDNYPVNDGAAMAPFLHLGPFRDRPPDLLGRIAGQAVNPMNQAWLSRIPLASLADGYRLGAAYDPEASFAAACRAVCGETLGGLLIEDRPLFERTGLARLSARQHAALERRYAAHAGQPCADEVLGWLRGDYAFDPACLT